MEYTPIPYLDAGAWLGEGPVWDDRKGLLYWVDIQGKALHATRFSDKADRAFPMPSKVGMTCLTEDGTPVVALEDGVYRVEEDGTPVLLVKNPEAGVINGNRFNDGKCDSRGRLWVGTMNMEGALGAGALYRIDPDLTCTKMLEGVSISNGLAWSLDDRYFYYADTPSGIFLRFDFDAETGSISNRTELIDYRAEEGAFDGLTIDAEGMLWIAHWDGFRVTRWNPETGKKLATVRFPVPRPSCCAFGGPGYKTLFVTTAVGNEPDSPVKKDYPLSGSLFTLEPGAVGLPPHRFGLKK